jgi:hypothetical protein
LRPHQQAAAASVLYHNDVPRPKPYYDNLEASSSASFGKIWAKWIAPLESKKPLKINIKDCEDPTVLHQHFL